MKITGLLISVVMTLMIFSPFTVSISVTPESDVACIVTIDVCHAKDGLGFANTDLPACCEAAFIPVAIEPVQAAATHAFPALSFDLSLRKDRPPRS